MSKARLISPLTTGLAVLVAACWLATGVFPLTASPQEVNDAAGITVNLNGSTVLHRTPVHYPSSALQRGVQGSISVEVKLDSTGNVSDAHVLSGPDELRSAVLQSVLEWHFTRDAANSTREVQVAFELPASGAAGGITGVPGGVVGGVPGGVVRGIVGGVPGGALAAYPDGGLSSSQPLSHIMVLGMSDQSRDELLATLPVHQGDTLTGENKGKAEAAVKAFDEHLTIGWLPGPNGDRTLLISAPGAPPPPPPPPPAGGIPQDRPERIKVGGNVQSMMIVNKVPPVYPQLAKSAGVEGVVRLAAVIAKDGTIQEIHVLSGPALLIQATMDAVKQWVYRPTLLNGEPVAVETTIDINFTLQQ
jgi:TonB family protein